MRRVLITLLLGIYLLVWRPKMLRSGATQEELDRPYEHDELIPKPNLWATRAIDIAAPPDVVWLWLAQMGRERTGFYGLDRFDNWNIPSATYIRHDLPPLEVNALLDNNLKVLDFLPHQFLLFGGFAMPNDWGGTTDITFLYHLESLGDGQSRLLIRMRGYSDGWRGWLYNRMFEVLDYFTTTAQLRGIKARAETSYYPYPAVELTGVAPIRNPHLN